MFSDEGNKKGCGVWFCTVPDDLPQMLLDDDEAEVRRLDKRLLPVRRVEGVVLWRAV